MKKYYMMATMLMASMLGATAQAEAERARDFTLIDHLGDAHQLTKYGYADALVIISQVNGCQINHENIGRYKVLRTNWDYRNVEFVMINSHADQDREAIIAENSVWEYDFPIMEDRTQLVAEDLGISKGGQVVVIEPTRGNILYRGPLEGPESNEITNLLTRIVEEDADTRQMDTQVIEFETAEGCEVAFPAKERHMADVPDYETEVAPILIERCVGCHIEGGIGPFAMNSHQMVQGWSPMIREVVMTKRMPPMQVDPNVRNWINSGNMPVDEVQTLIHWIEAGAPRE